jgi:hypothetical protein
MVLANIVYGFLLTDKRIKQMYPSDQYPQYYTIDEIDGTETLIEDLFNEVSKSFKMDNDRMATYYSDFEYSTNDDPGEDSYLIGIKLDHCRLNYSGVVKTPEIDESTRELLMNFVKANPVFEQLNPHIYVFIDSER